jgi:Protein of unknown function (DUF3999)
MSRYCRLLHTVVAFGLGLFTVGPAWAVTPQDYATGRNLTINGGAALGVFTLPLDVMTAVKGDLAQVAVFNSQGNVVPYALRVPEAERRTEHSQTLPLFPILESDAPKSAAGATVAVTMQRDGTLARVYVADRQAPQEPERKAIVRYLVDASLVNGSIEELAFVIRPEAGANTDFTWTLELATGNSLDHLTHVTYSGTLAQLTHQGTSLNVGSIKTPGLRERYLSITWGGKSPGVIERVEAVVTGEQAVVVPQSTEVSATRLTLGEPSKPASGNVVTSRFALVYDAQAVLPLRSLELGLREANTLAKVDVYVSSEQPQGAATLGTLVFSGNVYRLSHNGAKFVSAPIALNRSGRYITVTANQAASEAQLGLSAEQAERWPRLTLLYSPTQALFVATGEPPFTLAYGSYQPSQAVSASELLAVNVSLNAEQIERDNVTAGESVVLGSPSAPQEPLPWQRIGLWSVLVVGVGVLVVMTRGLLRRVGS